MNEPNSIIAGLLALSVAAGTKTDPVTGKCSNKLDLPEAKSTIISGTVLWPGAAGADVTLFNYQVPANQCLIVDYVCLASCDASEASAALDYGINWNATAYWQTLINGTATRITNEVGSQNIFNRPIFMVFASGTTPQIVIKKNASTQANQSRLLLASMNAYQCNSNLFSIFNQYTSNFGV